MKKREHASVLIIVLFTAAIVLFYSTTQTYAQVDNCDPSYPDVCISPPPPDLNCPDVPYKNIRVLPPDPHGLDGYDGDGIGCES